MDVRYQAYKEKFIKHLSFQDLKVCLYGKILHTKEKGFIMGDGTGEVFINTTELTQRPSNATYVRIFGRLIPYEEGFEIQADIIQPADHLDREAYTKIKEHLTSRL